MSGAATERPYTTAAARRATPIDAVSLQRVRDAELSAAAAVGPRGRALRELRMLRPPAFDDVRRDRPLLSRRTYPGANGAAEGDTRLGLLRLGLHRPVGREVRLRQYFLRPRAATRSARRGLVALAAGELRLHHLHGRAGTHRAADRQDVREHASVAEAGRRGHYHRTRHSGY